MTEEAVQVTVWQCINTDAALLAVQTPEAPMRCSRNPGTLGNLGSRLSGAVSRA